MGVARGSGRRVSANMRIRLLQRINETGRRLFGSVAQVARDGLIDIPVGQLARNDRLRNRVRS